MAESTRYSEFSSESDETKKRSAEQSALIKELSELEGLLVKEKSRFRKFLEKKLNSDMGLWLGEDTPGADTLDIVSYLLAFVFLACLITLAIMSGNLFAAPLFLLIPSVITTVMGVLYALYRTVMPRRKWATNEQAAFIKLLEGNGPTDNLRFGEKVSEGLLFHFPPAFNEGNQKYTGLIKNNDLGENFLHRAVRIGTLTFWRSFIENPLGKRLANYLINQKNTTFFQRTPLMSFIDFDITSNSISNEYIEVLNILLSLREIDLNLTNSQGDTPLQLQVVKLIRPDYDKHSCDVASLLIDKMPIDNVNIEVLEKSKTNLEKAWGLLSTPAAKAEYESKENSNENEQEIVRKMNEKMNEKINQINEKLPKLKKKTQVNSLDNPSTLFPSPSGNKKSKVVPVSSEPSAELKDLYKNFYNSNYVNECALEKDYLKILAFAFQEANPKIFKQLITRLNELKYLNADNINNKAKWDLNRLELPLLTWVINPKRLKEQKSSEDEIVAKVKALIEAGVRVVVGQKNFDVCIPSPLKVLINNSPDLLELKPSLVGKLLGLLIKERGRKSGDFYYTDWELACLLNDKDIGLSFTTQNKSEENEKSMKFQLNKVIIAELINRGYYSSYKEGAQKIPEDILKALGMERSEAEPYILKINRIESIHSLT